MQPPPVHGHLCERCLIPQASGALLARDSLHTLTFRCLPRQRTDQIIIWWTNTAICGPKSLTYPYNLSTVFENQSSAHFLWSYISSLLLTISKWLQQLPSAQYNCSVHSVWECTAVVHSQWSAHSRLAPATWTILMFCYVVNVVHRENFQEQGQKGVGQINSGCVEVQQFQKNVLSLWSPMVQYRFIRTSQTSAIPSGWSIYEQNTSAVR